MKGREREKGRKKERLKLMRQKICSQYLRLELQNQYTWQVRKNEGMGIKNETSVRNKADK